MVSLLDGSRETAEVVRAAATYGIRQEVVHRVIGLLATAGVLDDFPAGLRAALPDYLQGEDRARAGVRRACLRARGRRCGRCLPGGGRRSPGYTGRAGVGAPASPRSSPRPAAGGGGAAVTPA